MFTVVTAQSDGVRSRRRTSNAARNARTDARSFTASRSGWPLGQGLLEQRAGQVVLGQPPGERRPFPRQQQQSLTVASARLAVAAASRMGRAEIVERARSFPPVSGGCRRAASKRKVSRPPCDQGPRAHCPDCPARVPNKPMTVIPRSRRIASFPPLALPALCHRTVRHASTGRPRD